MKNIVFAIALQLLCLNMAVAQNDYDRFYRKYKQEEGVVTFRIPVSLIRLVVDDEDEDLDELFDKVDDVSFFAADDARSELVKGLKQNLPESTYKDMMEIKDGSSTILFKAKEAKDGLEEILMTIEDRESIFVMCITGNFTFEEAKYFIKSVNVDRARGFRN